MCIFASIRVLLLARSSVGIKCLFPFPLFISSPKLAVAYIPLIPSKISIPFIESPFFAPYILLSLVFSLSLTLYLHPGHRSHLLV